MRRIILLSLTAALLMASAAAAADESTIDATISSQAVTGTILAVSYATGDILICQDGGSVLALYGLERDRLLDIGAGDRVAVTFGENLEVAVIQRIDL